MTRGLVTPSLLMRSLPLLALSALALCAPTSRAVQLDATQARGHHLGATRIASGLTAPLLLCSPPGDVRRQFVLERAGRVRIIEDGALLATPFLDITAEVATVGEVGLLGLAFHPDFEVNGRFYVSFDDLNDHDVVREYRVSANRNVADASTFQVIFDLVPPNTSQGHHGGCIRFGPDRMLYLGIGDRGYWTGPQSGASYAGKLLRIDVDAPPSYVPSDNPYASPSDGVLDLIWAFGLRQPWRFSFDAATGDLWLGDVGDVTWDEIDFQPASSGAPGSPGYQGGRNYGWPCREGTLCTAHLGCTCPSPAFASVPPLYQYRLPGSAGTVVMGGFVYRGSALPWLRGAYVFADVYSGHVFELRTQPGAPPTVVDHQAEIVAAMGSQATVACYGIGEDAAGELYLLSQFNGGVWRIGPAAPYCTGATSYCAASANSGSIGARMSTSGTNRLTRNDLVLRADLCPPSTSGVFLASLQSGWTPFGNGYLCLGGTISRTPLVSVNAQGVATWSFDWTSLPPPLAAGQRWYFQFQFRDAAGGGAQFNLSDALYVTTCP